MVPGHPPAPGTAVPPGAGRAAFIQLRLWIQDTVSRENLMFEMRPLVSPQLFCFGTSGTWHPAYS